jgi:Phosphotransferase enzyme family
VGPVDRVEGELLSTVGYSGARHARLVVTLASADVRTFVLKRCDPASDWTALRTNDRRGREWSLLAERALDGVWKAFVSPFVAYAVDHACSALLMEDLSAHVFPDVREPIALAHEDELVGTLARLHAIFWCSKALSIPWLADAARMSDFVTPGVLDDGTALALMPAGLRERLRLGWDVALGQLSPRAARLMRRPGRDLVEEWRDLPATLVHGDSKVANFAPIPGRGVAAFDWAIVGVSPPTTDLGWYLGVNASRLARGKEALIAFYRDRLERELGASIDSRTWARLEDIAIIHGARTLLWTKGTHLAAGTPQGIAEWTWWKTRLEDVADRAS